MKIFNEKKIEFKYRLNNFGYFFGMALSYIKGMIYYHLPFLIRFRYWLIERIHLGRYFEELGRGFRSGSRISFIHCDEHDTFAVDDGRVNKKWNYTGGHYWDCPKCIKEHQESE